jgi:hypothetical protein
MRVKVQEKQGAKARDEQVTLCLQRGRGFMDMKAYVYLHLQSGA